MLRRDVATCHPRGMLSVVVNWAAVEAVATTLAAVVTAAAFIVTYRLLRLEAQARKAQEAILAQERSDRERSQARLVSGWVDGPLGVGDHDRVIVTINVRNLSDEPVAGVVVYGLYEPVQMKDGTYGSREKVLHAWELVPPGETLSHEDQVPGMGSKPDLEAPAARIEFLDAHGLKWTRWPDATLVRVLEPAP